MRLPVVAIASAFAGGILLGLSHSFSTHAGERSVVAALAMTACVLLVAGVALICHGFLWCAGGTSLVGWVALGVLAACLAQRPLPPEHILTRVAAQQVPLRTPLRWHGALRSEPSRLPWGYGLDIDL